MTNHKKSALPATLCIPGLEVEVLRAKRDKLTALLPTGDVIRRRLEK